jgi:hypothetical protein
MNKFIFKTSYVLILVCLLVGGCAKEYTGISEKPEDIISTKACPTLYGSIMEQFPEGKDTEANQYLLFDPKAEKKVVLLAETQVYVSFISEGAGYSNSFGWYAYDRNNPPASAADLERHVLFPNVSGNALRQGDMLPLQNEKFPAGTVIGFFLLVRGWQNGAVDYSKPAIYTDFTLHDSRLQQHILYKQKNCGDVVLAFEDQLLNEGGDADFNDIIFTITDNSENKEVSTFDLRTMVRM